MQFDLCECATEQEASQHKLLLCIFELQEKFESGWQGEMFNSISKILAQLAPDYQSAQALQRHLQKPGSPDLGQSFLADIHLRMLGYCQDFSAPSLVKQLNKAEIVPDQGIKNRKDVAVSGQVIVSANVDVGAVLDQQMNDVVEPVVGRFNQGRVAVQVSRIRVGAVLEEKLHGFGQISPRTVLQRRPQDVVRGVNATSVSQQQRHDFFPVGVNTDRVFPAKLS